MSDDSNSWLDALGDSIGFFKPLENAWRINESCQKFDKNIKEKEKVDREREEIQGRIQKLKEEKDKLHNSTWW